MAGKFLKRAAIVDTGNGEHRINAIRKRSGLTRNPVRVTSCVCPDPNCGAFHVIETGRTIPTAPAQELLEGARRVVVGHLIDSDPGAGDPR